MKTNETYEQVKMWVANDWDLKEDTPDYYLLKKNTASGFGHFIVFMITFWFTIGIGNLIYHGCCYRSKKILK
jgi:hypothetical protein